MLHMAQVMFFKSRTAVWGAAAYAQPGRESSKKVRNRRIRCFLSTIEDGQHPWACQQTERDRHQHPKENPLYLPGTVSDAVIVNATALWNQVQLPEGESK